MQHHTSSNTAESDWQVGLAPAMSWSLVRMLCVLMSSPRFAVFVNRAAAEWAAWTWPA